MLGRTEKNRGNPHVAEVRPHIADNSVSELTGNPRLGGFPGALLGDGQVEAAKLCLEMDVMAMRCLQGRQIGLLAGDGRVPVMPVRMHTAAGRVKIVSDEGKVDDAQHRQDHEQESQGQSKATSLPALSVSSRYHRVLLPRPRVDAATTQGSANATNRQGRRPQSKPFRPYADDSAACSSVPRIACCQLICNAFEKRLEIPIDMSAGGDGAVSWLLVPGRIESVPPLVVRSGWRLEAGGSEGTRAGARGTE